MKKLILCALLCLSSGSAWAMIIPTTFIGSASSDDNNLGPWIAGSASFLGPASRGGFAYGFSIDQPYELSSITMFVQGHGDVDRFGTYDEGTYQLALYKGTGHSLGGPIPVGNNKIYESDKFDVVFDDINRGFTQNAPVDLDAGDYWLHIYGRTGYRGLASAQAKGFQLEGEAVGRVNTPEPASLLLMGLALPWVRRRKITSR